VPVIVMVGEATPGPAVPLNDTEVMLGRCAGEVAAALAANAGTVARAMAAVAAVSIAALGRHQGGLWLAGLWMVMAGSFLCGPVLV
jgi:hypothetical protein